MLAQLIFIAIFLTIITPFIVWAVRNKLKASRLKRHGEKVIGTVVAYSEVTGNSRRRVGGHIYKLTVQFTTKQGTQITGIPITGFTSQNDIPAGFQLYVYYNPANPKEFYAGT